MANPEMLARLQLEKEREREKNMDAAEAQELVASLRQELDERQVAINELKQKMAEMKVEMDYTLKRKEMDNQEEMNEVTAKLNGEIDELKKRVEELEKVRDKNMDEYNAYLLEVKKTHQGQIDNVEAHFNSKLISEFEKYNALQNLLEETIREYESRIMTIEGDRGQAIEDLVDYFEAKVREKNTALEVAFSNAKNQMSEAEEMKKQIEEDADQEILEITTSYERRLRHEREMNAKLKGEAGIMTKKLQSMHKEVEEKIAEVQRLHTKIAELTTIIQNTEREVIKLQKELVDSEAAIAQKDKNIAELQKNNSDLEKFKFLLEHKIKEMKKSIEPKVREIVYLKQQNTDMEEELNSTIKVRSGLQLQVSELQNKLKMTDREYNIEKNMRMRLQVLIDRIRSHIARAMSVLSDHRLLKIVVKNMYDKYGDGYTVGQASSAEQEAICELVRQKQHLEISLTSIKRKLLKDSQFTRAEQLKIMHENMMLVYEINSLRAELKRVRDKVASYEASLGLNQTADAAEAAEMRYKLQHAIEERDEIDIQHERDLEGKNGVIEAQQEEIDTLSTKILKVHEFFHDTTRADIGTGPGATATVEHIKTVLSSNNTNAPTILP